MSIGRLIAYKMAAATLALGLMATAAAVPPAAEGTELVRTYCSGCHQERGGGFDRISSIRKTPEGWLMTLFRMRQVHGLNLDEPTRDSLVRFLADTQGLAPSESAAGRFALERRPNAQDLELGPELGVMCGRCHSLARSALQRRDADEWRKLAHMHVGQWPSLEYSASGRDRPWFQIATGPLPAKLEALYPRSSSAWSEWSKRKAIDLSGVWVVVGKAPGKPDFFGTAKIERDVAGDYRAHYELADVNGTSLPGESKAIVYTGYEWRGSAEMNGQAVREVYAVSEDGSRSTGRWFDADHPEDGGDWLAIRDSGSAKVVAVLPQAIRTGATTTVTIVGAGLGTKATTPSFGEGTITTVLERTEHSVRAKVAVASIAAPGLRGVTTGGANGQIAVYKQIDKIDVVPAYGIARVGGGKTPPVTAQFEALGATRLPDGKMLALGPVRASWRSVPFDAEATRTEDDKFAGHFDQRGCFLPAGAGPNPAREYSGDNVGNLKVLASVDDAGKPVEGQAHLVVTVQRWNNPPIY